jgi:hypothetical protein
VNQMPVVGVTPFPDNSDEAAEGSATDEAGTDEPRTDQPTDPSTGATDQ